ncbi:MAG TPA: isoaspartyl peptidase/L-asparaginase [Steroidobacteraceae bacterium]|nr:isoaspartyl peptidase/L-asparaginase [Steroidobacteraceae bacterium]
MYALAIHGGAGTVSAADLAPGPERDPALRDGLAAALQAGQRILEGEGSALDAVQAAVTALEDDPLFNAGRGAVLTLEGSVELDASIMEGTSLRAGAVALVRHTKNPIRLARYLLEHAPHVFLAGEAADRLAAAAGSEPLENADFITEARREQLRAFRARGAAGAGAGTVGAVARDRRGRLAAATSTGGTTGKWPGRIGDSPVIGAGTYADDAVCAVSMTGQGEWFLRTAQAHDIAARMRYGHEPLARAIDAAFTRLTSLGARGGLIAVDAAGAIVTRYNGAGMLSASVREGAPVQIQVR